MLKGFRDFIARGNVIDLAVGIVIGAAFTALVNAFVVNLINPIIGLFTGKDLTFPIEQDNSDVRHHLARFRRRSKVTSRARHMVDGALRLLCHLRQPENFLPMRDTFLSIFG